MVRVNVGNDELRTKGELADSLREIAERIDDGYTCGCTTYGICWDIDGEEEEEDDDW